MSISMYTYEYIGLNITFGVSTKRKATHPLSHDFPKVFPHLFFPHFFKNTSAPG